MFSTSLDRTKFDAEVSVPNADANLFCRDDKAFLNDNLEALRYMLLTERLTFTSFQQNRGFFRKFQHS